MHYAMTTSRPFIPPIGVPPPPPPTWMTPTRPTWTDTSSGQLFPPAPPSLPHTTQDYTVHTPQRHNTTPRSPPSSTSPSGNPSVQYGYTGRPIEIPPVEQWKPDVDFHDTKRGMAWTSRPKSVKAGFPATRTLKVWILYSPRHSQYLASSYCLWKRNLRHSIRQHRHYSIFIAELVAQLRSRNVQNPPSTPDTSGPASTPIARALQGQASASTTFDPATLLVSPGSVNPWLVDNQPLSLTETQYKKWFKDLKLPQHKLDTLEKQLEKVTEWWQNQPDDAVKTIQRASVAMGIDPCKHKGAATDEIVLKVMTVAMLMHS